MKTIIIAKTNVIFSFILSSESKKVRLVVDQRHEWNNTIEFMNLSMTLNSCADSYFFDLALEIVDLVH